MTSLTMVLASNLDLPKIRNQVKITIDGDFFVLDVQNNT